MSTQNISKMLLGLDYELFFGAQSGTVEACLIQPTEAIVEVMNRFSATLTLFVDIGYLVKLKALSTTHPKLIQTYDKVARQLNQLSKTGHDLQLHIHPHWEDAHYQDGTWDFSNTRFKLQDFTAQDIEDICIRYKAELEEISEAPVFAFRAGGWCLQPFNHISPVFEKLGIWLDSTVFKGGYSADVKRGYDFRTFPKTPTWRFSTEPTQEDKEGHMLEVPISQLPHTPWFFWKMVWIKKMARDKALHSSFGDGNVIPQALKYYIERLTRTTFGPASIDGIKASTLEHAFAYHNKHNPNGYFNVMGHPKSLSRYSIQSFEQFLQAHREVNCIGFKDLQDLRVGKADR